jgi:hypothetical protein
MAAGGGPFAPETGALPLWTYAGTMQSSSTRMKIGRTLAGARLEVLGTNTEVPNTSPPLYGATLCGRRHVLSHRHAPRRRSVRVKARLAELDAATSRECIVNAAIDRDCVLQGLREVAVNKAEPASSRVRILELLVKELGMFRDSVDHNLDWASPATGASALKQRSSRAGSRRLDRTRRGSPLIRSRAGSRCS